MVFSSCKLNVSVGSFHRKQVFIGKRQFLKLESFYGSPCSRSSRLFERWVELLIKDGESLQAPCDHILLVQYQFGH